MRKTFLLPFHAMIMQCSLSIIFSWFTNATGDDVPWQIFLCSTPVRLSSCSSNSEDNLRKYRTKSTPPTLLAKSASSLMSTLPFHTKSHPRPNPAIVIFVIVAVSAFTLISKQLVPLSPPSFTHNSSTNLPKFQITHMQQIQNSVARAVGKAAKIYHFHPTLSLYWLRITERIEHKLLSLTKKFWQPPNLHNLHNFVTVQPRRSTRSSSVFTLAIVYLWIIVFTNNWSFLSIRFILSLESVPCSFRRPHLSLSISDSPLAPIRLSYRPRLLFHHSHHL